MNDFEILEYFNERQVNFNDPSCLIYMNVKYDPDRPLNKIFELYESFNEMYIIDCSDTFITSIPKFDNMEELNCNNCHIKEFAFNATLYKLTCYGCSFEIPFMPNLKKIYCDKMQVISEEYNLKKKIEVRYCLT